MERVNSGPWLRKASPCYAETKNKIKSIPKLKPKPRAREGEERERGGYELKALASNPKCAIMYANLFVIRKTGKYGKGLFATQFVPRGTIVCFWCKKCGTYSKKDLAKLSKKKLDFVIEHEEKAGPGLLSKACDKRQQYINHSCNPHILETGMIGDIVVKDIEKGEEATEDYRVFYGKSYFKRYFKNGCKCGQRNCAKMKLLTHPSTAKLRRHWKKEINAALRLIPYVKQPLKRELLKERPELSRYFKKP